MKKLIILIISMLLVANCSREKSDWQDAKIQNSVPIYEQFIKNYPQSTFKDSAAYKIEELSFNEVIKNKNINDYNNFIMQFPKSIFVDSVKNKILELSIINARISKNIIQIVSLIDSNPNNKIIQNFLISSDEKAEFKSPKEIYEDFITIIKKTNNKKKLLIQLRVPPKRKISSNIYYYLITLLKNWKAVEDGSLIIQYAIVNHEIAGISHYESGDKGFFIKKEIRNDIIIPLTSKFIRLDQNIILKISDNVWLYSTSNETKFQRIDKTNNFKLIAGSAYQINLNQ